MTSQRKAVDSFIKKNDLDGVVQEMIRQVLIAKPENPRRFLLEYLEKDVESGGTELTDADLQKLFLVSRRITGKIVPQETINITITETIELLSCDAVSLFVLDRKMQMLRLYESNTDAPVMVKPGQGIAGTVFLTQEVVNIPNCYQDSRFDQSFDKETGYYTRSMVVVPIVDFEDQCVGVIQAINKMPSGVDSAPGQPRGKLAVPFSKQEERMLQHLAEHIAIALQNAEVYREAINCSERATGLLNTIQSMSQDLGPQSLLLTVTNQASKVCSAQRSTVFLLDEGAGQLWSVSTDTGAEIRIPKDKGIAGECCSQGQVINIPDAYADPRFNKQVDIQTGYRTRSILAVPILQDDHSSRVVGVMQMINKVAYDGQLEYFDEEDVEIMQLFASFVGPKLTSSTLATGKEKTHVPEGKLALGLELPPSPSGSLRSKPSPKPAGLGRVAED
mmetsp:Transcript_43251/g.100920  ORF Transcript_43251/g.100920 Transcript_43251/m.100920 type:complete len:447 (+) Transcript_43251:44-1384(+)